MKFFPGKEKAIDFLEKFDGVIRTMVFTYQDF